MNIKVDPTEFAGKRVLVSGGTKGLGRATVARFLAGGARVITAARAIKDPIAGVDYVKADLTTPEGGEALAKAALQRLDGIDIVAHVIGGSASPAGGFAALTDDHWLAELNLNLLATVRLDRLLIPQMIGRGEGCVVHVTSIQSVLPLPESTTGYAAAKAALRTYSKSISKELGPKGVRVNSVSPGWIMTGAAGDFLDMLRTANGGTTEDARQSVLDALGGIPIGRGAEPEEVADLIGADGFGIVNPDKFQIGFAADASDADAAFLRDSQVPINMSVFGTVLENAAWRTKPSWAIIATEDKAFDVAMLHGMAKRIGAEVTQVKASHALFMTQPAAVAEVIIRATEEALVANR